MFIQNNSHQPSAAAWRTTNLSSAFEGESNSPPDRKKKRQTTKHILTYSFLRSSLNGFSPAARAKICASYCRESCRKLVARTALTDAVSLKKRFSCHKSKVARFVPTSCALLVNGLIEAGSTLAHAKELRHTGLESMGRQSVLS